MTFGPASAEEPGGVSVNLGLGAEVVPDYFGASSMHVAPTGAFTSQKLVLPGGFGIGSQSALPTDPGFGPRGAFRFVAARNASNNSELQGVDDIDHAVEVGLGLFQITERSRIYGEVRRGFGGHDGWVAEAGIDGILRPSDRLVLTAGPRVHWGDTVFVDTYFGVTSKDAADSQYAAYDPDGGLVSLGVELNARYDFQNGWLCTPRLAGGSSRATPPGRRSPKRAARTTSAPVSSSRAPSRSADEDRAPVDFSRLRGEHQPASVPCGRSRDMVSEMVVSPPSTGCSE
jgi:outer membrane protein